MIRALRTLDIWLLVRIFMPVAHWVDWRWHVNQYDLAARVMTAGLAMCVATNAEQVVENWRTGWANVISAGACVWVYSRYLRDLQKASHAYERDPSVISHEAAMFILTWSLRIVLLQAGVLLMSLEIAASVMLHHFPWTAIANCWMLLIAIAWYFAGGLPPTRTRKKKKERKRRAPALLPQPVPVAGA